MGCSIALVQKTPIDSNSSLSFDDLQENEISLDYIHEEVAFIKINVEKQKQVYPDDNITEVQQLVKCENNSLGTSNISCFTTTKKSCLKQSGFLSLPKKVHFIQTQNQLRNRNAQHNRRKKNKKKHLSRSQDIQTHINLDDIF